MTGYEIHRARTGRTVKSMTPGEIADDELVVNWIKSLSGHSIRKNKGKIRFHQLVKDVPIFNEGELVLFRGRDDIKSDPTFNDFGPPLKTSTKANRYNKTKHPVLYLCSSKQGVLLELKNQKKVIEQIYCQQFCLQVDGL